jgi:hypothetical protein
VQGALLPPHLCADDPLQPRPGERHHQPVCQSLGLRAILYAFADALSTQGDWKLSGLGLAIPLLDPNGKPTLWEFPTFDARLDTYVQRSFDYMGAPTLSPSS